MYYVAQNISASENIVSLCINWTVTNWKYRIFEDHHLGFAPPPPPQNIVSYATWQSKRLVSEGKG